MSIFVAPSAQATSRKSPGMKPQHDDEVMDNVVAFTRASKI